MSRYHPLGTSRHHRLLPLGPTVSPPCPDRDQKRPPGQKHRCLSRRDTSLKSPRFRLPSTSSQLHFVHSHLHCILAPLLLFHQYIPKQVAVVPFDESDPFPLPPAAPSSSLRPPSVTRIKVASSAAADTATIVAAASSLLCCRGALWSGLLCCCCAVMPFGCPS